MRLAVDITLTATDAGGRKGGIEVGYRANWDNGDRLDDGSVHFHDAAIVAMHVPRLEPGEQTAADIMPASPRYWDQVVVGSELRMCEGRREVGAAVVRGVTLEPDDISAR